MQQFTYLVLLFVWAAPVIALHWLVGAPELRRNARILVPAIAIPTIYLTLADGVAIGSGVWEISHELTVGWRVGSVVFEEAIFFFLTNVMVAQSILLFLLPEPRMRVWRLVKRLRGRADTPADVQSHGAQPNQG